MTKKGSVLSKATNKPVPVKIVNDKDKDDAPKTLVDDMKWRAQDALRDIQRAKKHEGDKTLMKEVKKLAKQEMQALKKIC